MVKKKVAVLLIAAGCFLIVFLIPFFVSDSRVLLNVKSGEAVSAVALRLKENKLICSEKLFLGLVKITKSQDKLKAGVYSFSRRDSMFRILRNLKDGSGNLLRFTVPEGSNIKQTAEFISRVINIDKDKFVKIATDRNAEGYLMPETYFAAPGMNEEQLIEMMQDEFNKKVKADMRKRAESINVAFKDIITLASIIEKEAVKTEEKAVIAAVFYNRLKRNIKLQSCATVLHAIGISKAKLTAEDVKFDSPYNTYRHFGLPPGPICSPGLDSIMAALYPADTNNLFFVSAGNGFHLFAKNFDGHKKNIQSVQKNLKKSHSSVKVN